MIDLFIGYAVAIAIVFIASRPLFDLSHNAGPLFSLEQWAPFFAVSSFLDLNEPPARGGLGMPYWFIITNIASIALSAMTTAHN